ncbi:hypothetical protein GCK72_005748 [Caenorhabditis remanei]|uniref:c-SKI SMAD4-binding domain-containing protein n=1 Tax=Caenorhabditis remanei TaxID=31234 RepID=A0A6A5HEJ8_CAERE|nr:hypothetical protein GCK72_005748 [Caenorhabditis remanei]KAF1765795.1 hypothetical protein GCK72_005748 [Caenorhabditis remanei]
MSDDSIGSSQRVAVEPEHHTPDLMDNDPLLENLKALHEETRSDDEGQEDDGQPGTSAPKKKEEQEEMAEPIGYRTKDEYHGKFAWISTMGKRIPSLLLNGEPYMPIEFLRKELSELQSLNSVENFTRFIEIKGIILRMCNPVQFNAIMDKSDICRSLNLTSINLISRSDLERIMGESRTESCLTKSEHDIWNPEDRIHIVHINFVDYLDDWLESDDLDEDPMESGVHGYWYKNRPTMRCIICRECDMKFTPNDFIVHHHYPKKEGGVIHMGLNSQRWSELIEVHSEHRTEVNLDAWNKFRMNSHRIGKRAYDDAEPQEPKKVAREKKIVVDDDDDSMEEDEDEGEEIPSEKPQLSDFLGPKGLKGLVPRNKLEKTILNCLNRMDEATLELLFLKTPEEYYTWIRECEFRQKVIAQQKEWEAKQKDPKSRLRTSANFNPNIGSFENMHMLHSAPKSTQKEIKLLADRFSRLQEEMSGQNVFNAWEFMLKEKELIASSSTDALRVLSNKPLPPPPKPKVVTPILPIKPTLPTLPISLSNINLAQVAQQLVASGIKLPLPLPLPLVSPASSTVPTTSAPTPAPSKPLPVLPFPTMPLPALPVNTNYEILKQQLSLALSSPSLFPIFYPKIPTSAYENLVNLLKTTAVKN